ncbi:MAG: HD domain-containing protein [Anaerolineae bacterium]|nr:HD domain-containing protein [Anaerolineae bacterium]
MKRNLSSRFEEVFAAGPVPDAATMRTLPFGQQLADLFYPPTMGTRHGDPKGAPHLHTVMEKVDRLLADRPADILVDGANPHCAADLSFFKRNYSQLWHGIGPDVATTALFPPDEHGAVKTFLRVAALYHDIGKYVNTDRHPTIGWYLVSSMYPDERAKLQTMLTRTELRTLLTIIRDHDKFGVLSSGEASLPLLASTTHLMQEEVKIQEQRLTALMLVSLADMSASFPLDSCVAGTVMRDWSRFIRALENAWGDRGRLLPHVVQEAQQYESTVERIRRLLMTISRDDSGQWETIDDKELISDILKTTFTNRIDVFCEDFALVAKLDYSLRFFRLVVQECRRRGMTNPSTITHVIVNILKGIVETYGEMLHARRGHYRLIGVEFSSLAPAHAPEKAKALINLLLERPAEGLAWLLSDVPAWYIWE